jgi:lipopolysaccharide export system protein LptA
MSAQRASAPVRLARAAAAVLMMALAAVLIARLAGRRAAPPQAPAPPPPEGRVVDLKERVRQQEFQDGRPVVDIRGASLSRGADGLNRLSGPVEVLSLGQDGRTQSRLTADEIAYSPGSLLFTVNGHVRVEAEGLTLEGDSFSYDKNRGIFATTSGGRFASEKIRGEAREISCRESAGEVRLGEGFRLEIAVPDSKEPPTSISGDSLVLDRGQRRGSVEGQSVIAGAGFKGTSRAAAFVISPDESSLESAELEGAPKIVLAGKDGSGEGSGEIRAGRVALSFSRAPSGLAVHAADRAGLTLRISGDRTETVLAPVLLLNVVPDDGKATWTASGGAKIEIAEAGAVSRTLEGEDATYDDAKVLQVSGGPGRPAVADSSEARIEAPKIAVASETGDILASGDVSCVLKRGEGRRKVGFFSPAEDILVSSGRFETRNKGSMSLFSGNVEVRQGTNSLRAGEIELAGDAGRMTGGGGIEAALTEAAAAGKPGRTLALRGQDMIYAPDSRTLTLTTKASVRLPDAVLEAGTVSVVIARDSRAVESLTALTDVTVTHGAYVGRSKAAAYEAATGRLALTGSPILTDDKGGSARGAKLTFNLPDDKIFIENEGAGRATTVIRS